MTNRRFKILLAASCLTAPSILLTSDAWALPGDWAPGAAVTTCSAQSDNEPVIGIEDLRSPSTTGGALGQAWNYGGGFGLGAGKPPMTKMWKRSQLGQIFGIALDGQATPDIFTSSTDIYQLDAFTNKGRYAIWRLRPGGFSSGGDFKLFYQGSGSGEASLGQIAYNPTANVLYASNFDDGKIYVITDNIGPNWTGTLGSTYDHGLQLSAPIPDTASPAYTGYGRRVWAVQYNKLEGPYGRLYYAVNNAANQNSVWSIALSSTGATTGTPTREFDVNTLTSGPQIADIAFTFDGQSMMIAERYDYASGCAGCNGGVHSTRVLHFTGGTGAWVAVAPSNSQRIGYHSSNTNSAGGVDYTYDYNGSSNNIDLTKPEGRILATGDALTYNAPGFVVGVNDKIYGIQSTALAKRFTTFATAEHYLIDFNSLIDQGNVDKYEIGDVEAWKVPYNPEGDGIIKVCKVAGDGVPLDTPYTFTDGQGHSVTVPAGPEPGGYCQVLGSNYVAGSDVLVQEAPGWGAYNIVGEPAGNVTPNIPAGNATVHVGAGVTEVTFWNKGSGFLEICKEGDVKGKFTFTVDTTSGPQQYTIPAGACTPAIAVVSGNNVKVVEAYKAGYAMSGSHTLPVNRWVSQNLGQRTVWVKVPPGNISTQTIVIVKNKTTGGHPVDDDYQQQGRLEDEGGDRLARGPAAGGLTAATSLGCIEDDGLSLCTAKVVAASASDTTPRGMMSYVSDGKTIAVIPVRKDGTATLALPAAFKAHEIVAAYLGDHAFRTSRSAPLRFDDGAAIRPVAAPSRAGKHYKPGEPAPHDDEAGKLNEEQRRRLESDGAKTTDAAHSQNPHSGFRALGGL